MLRKIAIAVLLCFSPICYGGLVPIPEIVRTEIEPPAVAAKSWILVHYDTDWVLAGEQAELQIEPASLTKLMTGYLIFDALDKQQITIEEKAHISKKAWKTDGSKMFVGVDTAVSINDLLHGLIVQSGNDAAVALAEHLSGSEQVFVDKMNEMAIELGMYDTHFVNSSGLPVADHYSSARDMTSLAVALIRRFPEFYRIYSKPEFTYNNITQQNRNILLARDRSVDGIKTGYTKNAGYCLIATAVRDGVRMVATVTGAKSKIARADEVQKLLRYGYQAYTAKLLHKSGDAVESVPLWYGESGTADIGVKHNLAVVVPRGMHQKLTTVTELPSSLEAPLFAGSTIGSIEVNYDNQPIYRTLLYVNNDYSEGNWLSKFIDAILRFFS